MSSFRIQVGAYEWLKIWQTSVVFNSNNLQRLTDFGSHSSFKSCGYLQADYTIEFRFFINAVFVPSFLVSYYRDLESSSSIYSFPADLTLSTYPLIFNIKGRAQPLMCLLYQIRVLFCLFSSWMRFCILLIKRGVGSSAEQSASSPIRSSICDSIL